MKILIPTIGSRGDIQPYIALGSGLQKAGYDVTFATHPTFRSLVEFHGLKFAPFGPDIDLGVDTAKLRENKHALDGNFIKVMKYSFDLLEKSHEDLMRLVADADLVIITHTSTGSIEAELLGKRIISGNLFAQIIPIPRSKQTLVEKTVGRSDGECDGSVHDAAVESTPEEVWHASIGRTWGILAGTEFNRILPSHHAA